MRSAFLAVSLLLAITIISVPAHGARTLIQGYSGPETQPQVRYGVGGPLDPEVGRVRGLGGGNPPIVGDFSLAKDGVAVEPDRPSLGSQPLSSAITMDPSGLLKPALGKPVGFEVRYSCPDAEDVYLLWGLDGWQPTEKSLWPKGTEQLNSFPHCRMNKSGDDFSIILTLPEGKTLDYCFHVLAPSKGLDIWDVNVPPKRDYHSVITSDGMAIVIGQGLRKHDEGSPEGKPVKFISPMLLIPLAFILMLATRPILKRHARKR